MVATESSQFDIQSRLYMNKHLSDNRIEKDASIDPTESNIYFLSVNTVCSFIGLLCSMNFFSLKR